MYLIDLQMRALEAEKKRRERKEKRRSRLIEERKKVGCDRDGPVLGVAHRLPARYVRHSGRRCFQIFIFVDSMRSVSKRHSIVHSLWPVS